MNRAFGALAIAVVAACTPTKTNGPIIAEDSAVSASATRSAPPATSNGGASPRTTPVRIVEALADSDALTLIRSKRLEAKADGRVLVVYVSATWCEPCKKFKAEMESGRLDARLAKVILLAFDADKDVDRLGAAGYAFKFVPFIALPAPDGHPSESQQATGKGGQAWRELLDTLDAWQRAPR